MRVQLLLNLNMYFFKLFKFVNHDFRLYPETNHVQHYALKDKVMPTLIFKLVGEQLRQVHKYKPPLSTHNIELKPDILIDKELADGDQIQKSVFDQVIDGLKEHKR